MLKRIAFSFYFAYYSVLDRIRLKKTAFSYTISRTERGGRMTNSENNEQVVELKNRFNQFIETLEAIEPENTDIQDIDRLIMLLDELEEQMDNTKK